MHTIVDRRVADLYRSREGKQTQPLPEELERGGQARAGRGGRAGRDRPGSVQDVIDREYAKLDNESHRMVIDLKVFQNSARRRRRRWSTKRFQISNPR